MNANVKNRIPACLYYYFEAFRSLEFSQLRFIDIFVKVGDRGVVVGIDHIDELVRMSVNNVQKDPVASPLLEKGTMKLVVGDGRAGYPPLAPYDAIHVGAAAPEIPQQVVILWLSI